MLLLFMVISAGIICVQCEYPPPPTPSTSSFQLPYLGLRGHKFFHPNPNAPKNAGMYDGLVLKNYKRVRAAARFFNHLFLGNPALSQENIMEFDPTDAMKWRPEYIRKFGYRGERLIKFLGSGPTKEQLIWSLGSVY